MSKKKIKTKGVIREWVESIIIAALLAIFVRAFFFQIYKIPTESMVPTLLPGDKIFVSKLIYGPKVFSSDLRLPGFRKPKRGEVIVFIPPHEKEKLFFKRKVYIKIPFANQVDISCCPGSGSINVICYFDDVQSCASSSPCSTTVTTTSSGTDNCT